MARARGDCGSNAFELGMAEVLHPCLLSFPYFLGFYAGQVRESRLFFRSSFIIPDRQTIRFVIARSVSFLFALFHCLEYDRPSADLMYIQAE